VALQNSGDFFLFADDPPRTSFRFHKPTSARYWPKKTERYLGGKQRIRSAVNDCVGIEPKP